MKKRYLLGLLFGISYLLLAPFFVDSATALQPNGNNQAEIDKLNQQIVEKKNRISQLEQSIADYKKKISGKELEATSLKNQISILDNYISQVELDIQATEETISTISLEIESLQLTIIDKERIIERQKKIVAELIRTMRENDLKSYIQIASTYTNFSDFYGKIQSLHTINNNLSQSIHLLKSMKLDLEDKKKQLSERKDSYDQLKVKLENRRIDLQEDNKSKEKLLVDTKSSQLVYTTMLNTLKKQYQEVENEITSIERDVSRRLEKKGDLNANITNTNGMFNWPSLGRYVTAIFHDPDYPFRNVFEHTGMDIRMSHGSAVRAAGNGYVARAKQCSSSSCYSYIMLVHDGGLATVYGHLSNILVREDQFVTKGDVIANSGGTPGTNGAGPFVTGPHLHFEVRKDGIPVNPAPYLGN